MANLANFSALLSDYASKGQGLPNVVLSQSSDLGQAFDQLVTIDNRREGESDAQLVTRYVSEICDAMADDKNAAVRDLFETTCAQFAAKVAVALKSIGAIKEQAKTLADDMDKLCNDLTSKNEFIQKNAQYGTISEDFPTFEWDGVKCLGSMTEVVKYVHRLISGGEDNPNAPTVPDQKLFAVVLNKIDQYLYLEETGELSSEDRIALIDAAQQANQACPSGTVEDVVDMVFCIKKFPVVFNILRFAASNKMSDIFRNVRALDQFISDVYPIVHGMVTQTIKLPEGALGDKALLNAQRLRQVCMIAGYYVQMLRTSIFSKSLLLQTGLLNSDLVEQFKEQGGTTEMIAYYIRHLYDDNRDMIPAIGITGEAIIKAFTNIAPEVDKKINETVEQVKIITTQIRAAAFTTVAQAYIARAADAEAKNKGGDYDHLVEWFMRSVVPPIRTSIIQYDANFIDASIVMIVQNEYHGTFVQCLQEKLGAAYLKLVTDHTSTEDAVTEDKITTAEVGVISGLIAEFVCDNFVEASTITERTVPGALKQPADPNTDGPGPVKTPEQVKETPGATPAQES